MMPMSTIYCSFDYFKLLNLLILLNKSVDRNLAECRKLLAISKSKEKDYEIIIKELKLNLLNKSSKTDQHVQAIHDLTQVISRLQEENKVSNLGNCECIKIKTFWKNAKKPKSKLFV